MESWKHFLKNPEKANVDNELAGIRALYWENFSQLGEEGSIPLWNKARAKFGEFRAAMASQDKEGKARASGYLLELEEILERGQSVEALEEKLFKRVSTLDRLINTQREIYETESKLLSLDAAFMLFGLILDTVARDVAGLDEGPQILNNLSRIIASKTGAVYAGEIISVPSKSSGNKTKD